MDCEVMEEGKYKVLNGWQEGKGEEAVGCGRDGLRGYGRRDA